jgi:putative ABC transport system permease protein
MLDTLWQDLRLATRSLLRSPGFSAAAILTLALAIGANVAIFAIVERVVLNPLPYPDSEQLVMLRHRVPRAGAPPFGAVAPGFYFHYADRARTLQSVALYRNDERTLTGAGQPERIRVTSVTPSMGSVLRVPAELGRWFNDDAGAPGSAPRAILSHGLWMRRFGGNPAAVGQSMTLDGVATQIVGVMPASFAFPNARVDVWLADQLSRAAGFGLLTHNAVARLRPPATLTDARAEMTRLITGMPQAFPGSRLAHTFALDVKISSDPITLKDVTIGAIGRPLWILFASVGLVLAIACANLANLFLVRSEVRQRDVAVRRALGATRGRVARHFLAESTVVSAAGGTLGLALAWWALSAVVAFAPPTLPRLTEIGIEAGAVLFALVLSALTAIVFGVVPLLREAPVAVSLHDGGRGRTTGVRGLRVRNLLMGAQVALALVLLVGSGLIMRSFQQIRAIDPGFDARSTLAFNIGLPKSGYATRAASVAAHHDILDRLAAQPGVAAVSATTLLPFGEGGWGNTLRIDGRPAVPGSLPAPVEFRAVAGDYIRAMGMRLVSGRGIDRGDVERQEPLVVVNQALVRAYFPTQDPIGQRIAGGTLPWLTIAGVVADTPTTALVEMNRMPTLYMPMSIAGGPDIPAASLRGPDVSVMSYVVRATSSPANLLPSVRRVLDGIDPTLAIAQPRTFEEMLDRASSQMAFTMVLLAVAAALALLLGTIGIYGVISYIVAQRTNEIGVRLAIGAQPDAVAGMILRQSAMVTGAGALVGLGGAAAGARFIASLLYGVSPNDPLVFMGTTALLLIISLLACWVPSRRAARIDPLSALRSE